MSNGESVLDEEVVVERKNYRLTISAPPETAVRLTGGTEVSRTLKNSSILEFDIIDIAPDDFDAVIAVIAAMLRRWRGGKPGVAGPSEVNLEEVLANAMLALSKIIKRANSPSITDQTWRAVKNLGLALGEIGEGEG